MKTDDTYAFKEIEMNQVGYQLPQNGKTKESIEVFKINVEEFPNSWNTYDGLGEGYIVDDRKKNLLPTIKKSVEMNPENKNGKQMLERSWP